MRAVDLQQICHNHSLSHARPGWPSTHAEDFALCCAGYFTLLSGRAFCPSPKVHPLSHFTLLPMHTSWSGKDVPIRLVTDVLPSLLRPPFHIPTLLHQPLHISSVGYSPDFALRLAPHDASGKSSFSVATRSHPINLSSLITLQIVRHFHSNHAHAFGVTFHQNS